MDNLRKRYGDRVRFLTLYIKEAHPLDEWQMESNEKESVCYPQPTTLDQRVRIANDFVHRFHYAMPLYVDPIENPANAAYAGIVDCKGSLTSLRSRFMNERRVPFISRRCTEDSSSFR